ncbi:hypothetical protein SAMN02787142_2513 [Burkholderia sp. WP9]|uniref:hypothetical protein n=1 Tax=Burkholderia sp. WP9 TaxID=1500263 RepID=UPI0008954362|nr:hypothetical protein [Burkholderia sp. WP9]SED08134.1 hypothetical protein SAMN02787142_2513 [Burkholderia sp. WP9]
MNVRSVSGEYARSGFSYQSLLLWEFSYVAILLLWAFTGQADALKLVANGFAFAVVLRVGVVLLAQTSRLDRASCVLMCFVLFFAVANLIVNVGEAQIGETIKILSIFMFYFAGQTTDEEYFENTPSFSLVALFVAVPVLSALFDLYRGGAAPNSELNEQTLSFFANRNNAVAFTVISSWTLMLAGVKRWLIVGYLAACVLAFKTLGALMAIAMALYLVYPGFNILRNLIIGAAVAGFYVKFDDDLEILARASNAWRSLNSVLAESNGVWGLSRLDYGQIYTAAGTSDISLIFRLKHWVNLIGLYMDGPLVNQIFGFGVGSSVELTEQKLVPHNDYLRFFFELGPGLLICFVLLNLMILRRIGAHFISIPAIFLFIYFFSDNLVNNFLVMSFFYFTAGAISSSARRSRVN